MITEAQFKEAADALKAPVSCIKAVYKIEANGSGFLDDGLVKGAYDSQDRVKILFEGHRFWKLLAKAGVSRLKLLKAAMQFPNVLYEKWDRKQYKGGTKEWDIRMAQAYQVCDFLGVHRSIAFGAASYGSFQIMGENYALCGYADAQSMLTAFNTGGEKEQLRAFVMFIKSKGLDKALREKNWPVFAKGYNGTGYRENKYDTRLHAEEVRLAA